MADTPMKAEDRARELCEKYGLGKVYEVGGKFKPMPTALAAILEALRDQREADAKLLDDHIKDYYENKGAQRTALQIAAADIRGQSHDR